MFLLFLKTIKYLQNLMAALNSKKLIENHNCIKMLTTIESNFEMLLKTNTELNLSKQI